MSVRSAVEGSATGPRTLADQLRGWPDERLAALLEARPDLAAPAPHDSGQLAARVVVRASVLRALDQLNTLELLVLQSLVQGEDPSGVPAAAASVHAAQDASARWHWCGGSPTGRWSSSASCSACRRDRRRTRSTASWRAWTTRSAPCSRARPLRRRRQVERQARSHGVPGGPGAAGTPRRAPRDPALVGAPRAATRRDRRAAPPGHLGARAVTRRPCGGRRRLRAGTTHRAAARPLGHPPAGRAEGGRPGCPRPARGRDPAARRARRRRAGRRDGLGGRPARPGL